MLPTALSLLELRVGRRAGEDAALAFLLGGATSDESDVTLLTPGLAPGVLDLVEVDTVVSAVADSQHTVVQRGTASSSEDTRLVQLEGGLVSLDGDGDRANVQGGHHGGVGVLGDINIRGDGRAGHLGASGLAGLVLGGVWVGGLSAETTVVLDPLKGVVHETTIAAHVGSLVGLVLAVVAIHQVLLREGDQGSLLVVVGTLEGTGGGE